MAPCSTKQHLPGVTKQSDSCERITAPNPGESVVFHGISSVASLCALGTTAQSQV